VCVCTYTRYLYTCGVILQFHDLTIYVHILTCTNIDSAYVLIYIYIYIYILLESLSYLKVHMTTGLELLVTCILIYHIIDIIFITKAPS